MRKIPGNWTFVIVTDREDLDGQIYRNFANTGAVLEDEKRVRADSGESLKRMLNQEDHRYVFTLIQKFRTEHGETYPMLSDTVGHHRHHRRSAPEPVRHLRR